MLLQGRIVLVTGAARGIGRASALVAAEEGADVAVFDLAPEVEATAQAIAKLGRRSVAATVDVADRDQVRAGMAKVRERLGDVEVLVNNAAIVANIAALEKMAPEAWDREIAVNLSGAFNLTREVIGPMIEKRWGRIINIASIAAVTGIHRQAGYAASKAGIIGFTQTVTLEHARNGITCNAILPGLIQTELVEAMPGEIRDRFVAVTPARRLGEMREIGYMIAFLASDRAAYVNGAAIPVDGGARLAGMSMGSRREAAELAGEKR
jgi:NAD(P)-dependent dehydrogenase (short-subunit alcohol dehydrogenase family)